MDDRVVPTWLRLVASVSALVAFVAGVVIDVSSDDGIAQPGLVINLLASVVTVGAALAVFDPLLRRFGAAREHRDERRRFNHSHKLLRDEARLAATSLLNEYGLTHSIGESPDADLSAIATLLRTTSFDGTKARDAAARIEALVANVIPLVLGNVVFIDRDTKITLSAYACEYSAGLLRSELADSTTKGKALADCCEFIVIALAVVRGDSNVERLGA